MPRERLVPPPIARLNELIRVDHATFVAQTLAIERVHADFMDAVMQDAMALAAQPASAAMTATAQVERALNAESMLRVIESFWRDFPPVYNYRSAFQWALDAPRKPTLKSSSKTGETTMARPEVGTIIAYSLRPEYDINDGAGWNRLFYVYGHPDCSEIGCSIVALDDADGYWAGGIYPNVNVTPTGTRNWMTLEDAESIVTGMKSLAAKFDPANYKPNVGDRVLVVRKPTEEKANQPVWISDMDSWLNRVYRVTRVSTDGDRVELDHRYWFALEWLQPVGITDPKKELRRRAHENLNALIAKWNSPYDTRRTRYKWYGESNEWGRKVAELKAIAEKRDATEEQVAAYINHIADTGRDTALKIEPTIFNGTDKLYRGSWQEIGFLPKKDFWRLHCLHVSTEDNSKIAYYPTLRHMREGREVRTTLGKYLTKYKDVFEYDENQIRNLAQKFIAMQTGSGYKLHFKEQDDPDGWVEVYNKGPNSCMKGEDATRIYASGVSNLRLAYLTDFDGDIVARCIVRDSDDPKVKGYVRVYPDPNGEPEGRRLKDLLEEAGYGNHTNLKGCLLSFIEDGSGIVCPYLDYGNGNGDMSQVVERYVHEGKTYLRAGYGHIGASSTGGYTEGSDQSACACCGEMTNDEDLREVRGGHYVCSGCLDSSYVEAYVRYGHTEYIHEDDAVLCESNGALYHVDYTGNHDIYQCEYTDNYYHVDDLEMTSRGYVFVEECVELDVPDDDDNEWAVKSDTVTLEDGRVVHEDMAEKDWITGEYLLLGDDGVVQIFARQVVSSRGDSYCGYVYTTLEALADRIDDWVVEFSPRFSSGRYVQSVSCITFKGQEAPGSAVISFRDLTYDMIRSDETFEKIFEYLDLNGLIEAREEAA